MLSSSLQGNTIGGMDIGSASFSANGFNPDEEDNVDDDDNVSPIDKIRNNLGLVLGLTIPLLLVLLLLFLIFKFRHKKET